MVLSTNEKENDMMQYVGFNDFLDAFRDHGRLIESSNLNSGGNFDYYGLKVLYEYLESFDQNMDLDVIGLCCEYAQDFTDSIIHQYNYDKDLQDAIDLCETAEDRTEALIQYLNDRTSVCGQADNGDIVYLQF